MRKAVGRLIWEGESDPSVTQVIVPFRITFRTGGLCRVIVKYPN